MRQGEIRGRLRQSDDSSLLYHRSFAMSSVAQRQCKQCRLIEREEFFRVIAKHDQHVGHNYRRAKCKLCSQTDKDARKSANRFLPKVTSTRRHHADRFGMTAQSLETNYGWRSVDMAHDLERASTTICPYCRDPFTSMGHGLRDITLDIVNPDLPPDYRTNCRWVCSTCNSAKQRMPPDLWGEYLLYADRWRKRQKELVAMPKYQQSSMF